MPSSMYFNGDLSANVIKFVIPCKENDEQIKSNLRTSIYCKIRLVANMVQNELRNKSTGIINNEFNHAVERLVAVVLHCLKR